MSSFDFDPPPQRLFDSEDLRYGIFESPLEDVDILDYRVPGSSHWSARFRAKQWQHWMFVGPELMLTMAIVDIGYLKLAWIQSVQRSSGKHYEWATKGLVPRCRVARSLWMDHCEYRSGALKLRFDNRLEEGLHRFTFEARSASSRPAIEGHLKARHDLNRIHPLVACMPMDGGHAMYTHKVPLPVQGEIRIGDEHYRFASDEAIAFSDVHKAYYPRHTWWDWACLAFRTQDGRICGVNLTHNLAKDPSRYNENILWLDGKPIRLGLARFERQRGDLMQPWRVHTDCGGADLVFRPSGGRKEDLNIGLLESRFQQLYGTWSGRLKHGEERIEFDEAMGLGEDHDCRW